MNYEKEYFNQFGADNIADAHINYMRNEEANESPNNANTMLGEVPVGNGVGCYGVIVSVTNVITHLNSLIHGMSLGANQNMCRVDFESAVEAFERLKRHFA